MADIKNYGIKGVGSDVQFGKGGQRVKNESSKLKARNADDTDFVNVQGADPVEDQDFVTKVWYEQQSATFASDKVQIPADGAHGGAINSWIVNDTTYSTALDDLNEILGLLVPPAPGTWPGSDSITDVSSDQTWQLASGAVPDNSTDGLPAAGSNIKVTFAASSTTDTVGLPGDSGTGPGTEGTITALLNGADVGSRTLVVGDDSGTYSNLQIVSNPDYPAATPGFYEVVQARIVNATAPAGYNKVQLTHSAANDTNQYYWLYDSTLASLGTTSGLSIVDPGLTTAQSSTIPHVVNGQGFDVSGTLNQVSGYSYRQTDAVTIQGVSLTGNGSPLSVVNYDIGDIGMPANPPALNTTSDTFTNLDAITANVHASGRAQVRFRNPKGGAFSTINDPILLVMGSATTTAIDEDNINTSGVTNLLSSGASVGNNAARVNMTGDAGTDTPNTTYTATSANWTGATALESFDATVVGGILKHDQTNYTTGYLPVGPDLSTQTAGTQYVTFMFRANPLSKFDIRLTAPGGVAGVWVKLAGVSDSGTYWNGSSADNGWWSMNTAYAGVGVPGTGAGANGSTGCAVAGTMPVNTAINNGSYTCTFGPESAANATNNVILVRVGLAAGDTITALQFTAASN